MEIDSKIEKKRIIGIKNTVDETVVEEGRIHLLEHNFLLKK